MSASWHVEIHDADDRTVCQADVSAERVGDIEAVRSEDTVGITLKGETVAVGYMTVAQAQQDRDAWTSKRWPLDKSGDPVVRPLPH